MFNFKGKITILKSLIVPHILLLASVLSFGSPLLAELDTTFFNIVWSNGLHTFSKNVLIQPAELGNLKMISSKHIVETANVMWIKRIKSYQSEVESLGYTNDGY